MATPINSPSSRLIRGAKRQLSLFCPHLFSPAAALATYMTTGGDLETTFVAATAGSAIGIAANIFQTPLDKNLERTADRSLVYSLGTNVTGGVAFAAATDHSPLIGAFIGASASTIGGLAAPIGVLGLAYGSLAAAGVTIISLKGIEVTLDKLKRHREKSPDLS